MILAFACALVLMAPGPDEGPLVPWYVPRSASVGVLINPPVVTPNVRLGWEGTIVSQPRNDLVWIFNLGTGVGLGVQAPMTEHSQHVAVAGLGYRSDRRLLHWGFQLGAGVAWYRAAYTPNVFYRFESRVVGYAEGRVQVGLRLSRHLILALYGGYASPFTFDVRSPGNTFVGGVSTGLVVDWR